MEKLTKLPLVGPVVAWFFTTRLWHVYEHLDARKWTRLAAAITFTSFLALFPVLAVGVAVAAALLPDDQMRQLQDTLTDQVPGISDQLQLQSLVDNAGTVGSVAGAALLFTGASWVGALRESLRAVWDLEEDPGNVVLRKATDLGTLLGLGLVGLVSFGGSAFAVTAVTRVAEWLGLTEGGVGTVLLRTAAYAAAIAADFLLLWYVLTLLPRVKPPRRAVLAAALQGAVGFELLKLLLGGYLQQVAAKNIYGAFGVPIALLLWISFMTKLLLYCAAWTATAPAPGPGPDTQQPVKELFDGGDASGDGDGGTGEGAEAEAGAEAGSGTGTGTGTGGSSDSDVSGGGDAPGREAATGGAPRTPPDREGPERPR
ncbi:YihY/virulence factor BrkB family protein [Streptomyces reniochalinae]|uniref:YihY/virulence factor BrkB family protein n=1 Tax=Streptomyces reniochalinae TaxID=2250578 RepID=A0A367ENW5_9ACTN|nr:YihY/virulence factor BrkB family protein [Streptomyces reniochalinae]RCG19295.1 YihY/virulence factor BrkB family protein [Streptomyces reniochalinae]